MLEGCDVEGNVNVPMGDPFWFSSGRSEVRP